MSTEDSIDESDGRSRICAPQLIENCVLGRSHLYWSIAKRSYIRLRAGFAIFRVGSERQSATVILAHIVGIFQEMPGKNSHNRFIAANEMRGYQLANSGDSGCRGGFATDPVASDHCFGICDFLFTHGDYLAVRTNHGSKSLLPGDRRADFNRGCQRLGVFDWRELFRNRRAI